MRQRVQRQKSAFQTRQQKCSGPPLFVCDTLFPRRTSGCSHRPAGQGLVRTESEKQFISLFVYKKRLFRKYRRRIKRCVFFQMRPLKRLPCMHSGPAGGAVTMPKNDHRRVKFNNPPLLILRLAQANSETGVQKNSLLLPEWRLRVAKMWT